MALQYKISDIAKGGLIYAGGDTVAALIAQEFDWVRMLGMLAIGATVYAFEIPNYFRWIDRKVAATGNWRSSLYRTLLAMLYFNPLWIARHVCFIKLLTGAFAQIGWNLLTVGTISFAVNIPVSLTANYLIQNRIGFNYRFLASAVFSGLMAIYYSLSDHWFG
jgi:hypothetical protein